MIYCSGVWLVSVHEPCFPRSEHGGYSLHAQWQKREGLITPLLECMLQDFCSGIEALAKPHVCKDSASEQVQGAQLL